MNPEISSAIAALAHDPKAFEAIVAIYEQGRRDGIQESDELAAILLTLPADFDRTIITLPIEELDLDGIRAYNFLKRNNVNTVWDLIRMSENTLRTLRNFKETDLKNIKTKLKDHGLGLRAGA